MDLLRKKNLTSAVESVNNPLEEGLVPILTF